MQLQSRHACHRLPPQGWTDATATCTERAGLHLSGQRARVLSRQRVPCRGNGFRMDLLLLRSEATSRWIAAGVDAAYRARGKPSDHAPTWVYLSDG